jgi:hypothetical protein
VAFVEGKLAVGGKDGGPRPSEQDFVLSDTVDGDDKETSG